MASFRHSYCVKNTIRNYLKKYVSILSASSYHSCAASSALSNQNRLYPSRLYCDSQNQPCRSITNLMAQSVYCQHLGHRGLIQVTGKDCTAFLQGLITNDMAELDTKPSMYAFMLNIKGRIQFDMIVHNASKNPEEPAYIIETEEALVPNIIKDMKKYKLRKKVVLEDIRESHKPWAVFTTGQKKMEEDIEFTSQESVVCSSRDPRVPMFGYRLVLPSDINGCSVMKGVQVSPDSDTYHVERYWLGLGEGTKDHPPGKALPLECNAVFLNGVSFDKGCYIGQELTARTHHTGVIRKRTMPLLIEKEIELSPGNNIQNEDGKNVGKYLNSVGRHGLGLMRVAELKGKLHIKNDKEEICEVKTRRPYWWPEETDGVRN